MFTFLVGKNHKPFNIHSELLRTQSPPLHALMNNDQMEESRVGVAVLEDDEVEVFNAFCHYAYTGVIHSPVIALQTVYPDQSGDATMEDSDEDDENKQKAKPIFSSRNLKFYAQLYFFATKYLFEDLRACARHHVWEILTDDDGFGGNAAVYLDFLKYVYENTSCDEPGGSLLRITVTSFISDYLTRADKKLPFEELFLSGGEVTRDVVYRLLATINDTGKESDSD
ncbi:BTB/POZ domain-containing protein [Aspergillus affinis]|uniref:BTB/POZ domain-containing protein n=1 Tax=Aspergillus affinis TaxID=1070780 RepID=UPI0022FDFBCA|nr:uncharacterized protein KD926_004226 [Aspergillus affinis]KAI9035257.1 hypothetical protein KD926_004226 [Aspergillus affinis]